MAGKVFAGGEGSVWVKENPGPTIPYAFLQGHGAGQFAEPGESVTPYYEASGSVQGKFVEIDDTVTPGGRVTFSFDTYYKDVIQVVENLRAPFHVQFRHKPAGGNVSDPLVASKILIFLWARKGQKQGSNAVARTPDNATPITLGIDGTAERLVSIVPITLTRITTTEILGATSIAVSRAMNRDARLGKITEPGQIVYVGTLAAALAAANLLKSSDYGVSFAPVAADPLAADSHIQAILLVGSRVIVVDGVANATLAYSDDGGATWTTIAGAGTHILKGAAAVDWSHIYFVATNGFIYKSSDGGATLQYVEQGTITTGTYNRIAMLPNLVGYAVAAANIVARTVDGDHWTAVTGPHAATVLNCVDVVNDMTAWVGDASGKLWVTEDGGVTWSQSRFAGDGAGAVTDIKFARDNDTGKVNPEVGFMTQTIAGLAKIFKTVDGGANWSTGLSANAVSISAAPINSGLTELAVLDENKIYAVGPATGALATILQGS